MFPSRSLCGHRFNTILFVPLQYRHFLFSPAHTGHLKTVTGDRLGLTHPLSFFWSLVHGQLNIFVKSVSTSKRFAAAIIFLFRLL